MIDIVFVDINDLVKLKTFHDQVMQKNRKLLILPLLFVAIVELKLQSINRSTDNYNDL